MLRTQLNAVTAVLTGGLQSRSGPGLHGRTGFVASWRPIHQNRCAVRVIGSPVKTLGEHDPMPGDLAWCGQRFDCNGLMVWNGARWVYPRNPAIERAGNLLPPITALDLGSLRTLKYFPG
jgi:hypothetical protein